MSTSARRRIVNDINKLRREKYFGISVIPFSQNMMYCQAIISGPKDTFWESGTFNLIMQFTEEYPTKPPDVRFITKMFHPNIYPDGRICLDILQYQTVHSTDFAIYRDIFSRLDILQNQWSALFDIASILTSIQSLLTDPNPDSPANTIASDMYTKDKNQYNKKVLECVEESWHTPDYKIPDYTMLSLSH